MYGLPKEFEKADIKDASFVENFAPETLDDYCRIRDGLAGLLAFPMTIVLSGGHGRGKTHIAAAIVNSVGAGGGTIRYETTQDHLLELAAARRLERGEIDFVAHYLKYQLLVLDEFEVRPESTLDDIHLQQLICRRHENLVSTLLITNLYGDELDRRIPRAVRDRMRQRGDFIQCSWGSLSNMKGGFRGG